MTNQNQLRDMDPREISAGIPSNVTRNILSAVVALALIAGLVYFVANYFPYGA